MSEQKTAGISCIQAETMMFDYIEGTLSKNGKKVLEAHIEQCESCLTELAQRVQTIELIYESAAVPKKDLTATVLQQIQKEPKKSKKKVWISTASSITAAAVLCFVVFFNYDALSSYWTKTKGSENNDSALQMEMDTVPTDTETKTLETKADIPQVYTASMKSTPLSAEEILTTYAPEYIDTASCILVCSKPDVSAISLTIQETLVPTAYFYERTLYVFPYNETNQTTLTDFLDSYQIGYTAYPVENTGENNVLILLGME